MVLETVKDFKSLNDKVTELKSDKVFIYFTGNKIHGISWCPDCENALPALNELLEKNKDLNVIICEVGDRPTWNNPKNEYRTILKVNEIPTFMDWNQREKRTVGMQCAKRELLEMVIEQD